MRPAHFTPDQSPLPAVTLPFLAAAPWFAVAAGVLLAWMGPSALESRWTAGALALTHLLTVGFMLQAMTGALLQFACVVGGARIWRATACARWAQALMLTGGVGLPLALGTGDTALLMPAALALTAGIGVAAASIFLGLARSRAGWRAGGTLWPALLGLVVTAFIGVLLVATLAGRVVLPLPQVTDLHAAWGLGGWSLLLLMGVASIAVPMLHLTARYPRRVLFACAALVCGALLAWGLEMVFMPGADAGIPQLMMAAAAGTFAAVMLFLLSKARRPARDASARYWWMALASMLLASVARCTMPAWPAQVATAATLSLGILILAGIFVAAISGMMYKIVPFMLWLRLMRLYGARRAPGVAVIIPPGVANGQSLLFACALPALVCAPFAPWLARPAGVLFCASSLWLGVNVSRALWIHREAFRALPPRDGPRAVHAGTQPRG